jgi:hypothetical protein
MPSIVFAGMREDDGGSAPLDGGGASAGTFGCVGSISRRFFTSGGAANSMSVCDDGTSARRAAWSTPGDGATTVPHVPQNFTPSATEVPHFEQIVGIRGRR